MVGLRPGHTKRNPIEYSSFNIQPYQENSSMAHKERTTLFNFRAETIIGFKASFSSAFLQASKCRLGCQEEDDFSHIYSCRILNQYIQPTNINIDAIYIDVSQQQQAVKGLVHQLDM